MAGLSGSSPPARGAHQLTKAIARIVWKGSSPPARGARELEGVLDRNAGIIPACAGSTPAWTPDRGSSPLRGEHASGIIPACAGNTHQNPAPTPLQAVHPRLRGEHEAQPEQVGCGSRDHPRLRGEHLGRSCLGSRLPPTGSSPPARGAPPNCHDPHRRQDQGSSPPARGALVRMQCPRSGSDHPRLRGEHAHHRQPDSRLPERIIPACAGSTAGACCAATHGSSPPARGTHAANVLDPGGDGIIPACAGSTVAHSDP